MKTENRVVQTYCFRGDAGIFKLECPTDRWECGIEPAWDGNHLASYESRRDFKSEDYRERTSRL